MTTSALAFELTSDSCGSSSCRLERTISPGTHGRRIRQRQHTFGQMLGVSRHCVQRDAENLERGPVMLPVPAIELLALVLQPFNLFGRLISRDPQLLGQSP